MEIVRDAGIGRTVEERVTHADRQPYEPDQTCGQGQSAGIEERTDTLSAEFGERSFDDLHDGELAISDDIGVAYIRRLSENAHKPKRNLSSIIHLQSRSKSPQSTKSLSCFF
jgi:hypothetical protein